MPTFDVDPEPITVFAIDDQCLFAHYFERTDLFEELQEYYNNDKYRFEVPPEEFEAVRELLESNYYELAVVEGDELEAYCVVKEQYSAHADILRNSVLNWNREGHNFFILKDKQSIREAVEQGATPIDQTEFVLGL